ncbi:hypothetical protein [Aeromonas jandaei]|uniref:hypothetical protein n=1 Tax=Aeromonas jandaei TaxID=650 RepID=UPI0039866B77
MSDCQDFCEAFGGCASDPDFMDDWLAVYGHDSSVKSRLALFDYTDIANKYSLSNNEIEQMKSYMNIYNIQGFKSQKEANKYITNKNRWGEFPDIRSLNDHGAYKNVPGILPKFYRIACEILDITKGNGAPLIKATKY